MEFTPNMGISEQWVILRTVMGGGQAAQQNTNFLLLVN
jgi:hypothetical protein